MKALVCFILLSMSFIETVEARPSCSRHPTSCEVSMQEQERRDATYLEQKEFEKRVSSAISTEDWKRIQDSSDNLFRLYSETKHKLDESRSKEATLQWWVIYFQIISGILVVLNFFFLWYTMKAIKYANQQNNITRVAP